jgi:hypothetical protein
MDGFAKEQGTTLNNGVKVEMSRDDYIFFWRNFCALFFREAVHTEVIKSQSHVK